MGQHWYSQDAKPMHWIEGANGKMRDTTLRDARKLNLLPSVTTIIDVLDKPALTGWKLRQVIEACYERPLDLSDVKPTLEAYSAEVMQEAFAESTAQRDRGSEIHDAMEGWWNGIPLPGTDIGEIADQAIDKIIQYTEQREFTAEQTVAGDGYGGMIDLHNDTFLIDYKSKDIEDGKKMHWPENAMQLAAYGKALEANQYHRYEGHGHFSPSDKASHRRCINVFIDRTEPGKVVIHEWKPEEIELAWKKFQLLVQYWQLSKNYFPEQA